MKILKNILLLICFCSLTSLASHEPIFHPNGCVAWSGEESSSFYHDNYSIAWEGLEHPHTLFSYKSGQKIWDGFLYNECGFCTSSYASVYHLNGSLAWKGASRNDCYFTYDACSIFHDNGQLAWSGDLFIDCTLLTTNCIVYYGNGNVAWNGAKNKELYYSNSNSNFYHYNGAIAWKGAFAKDGASISDCGLYYDNGQLAWSGRTTDPIYDMNGNITTGRSDSLFMALGDNSSLQVHANGNFFLFVSLGNDCFLKFTNLGENPELWMSMGPGIRLYFAPRTGNFARLQVYDKIFPIR